MRDPCAPVIEGFDFSGIVNRYSFQCEQFFVEGDNGGTLLDGSTVTDALAAHVRLSWTLNSVSSEQYAALTAALASGPSPDTVSAYVFDPSQNAVRLAKFHVSRPPFNFAFDFDAGKLMSVAGGELVLEEAAPIARYAVTPPAKTAYFQGDALKLDGLSVTVYDADGTPSDITEECAIAPADGSTLANAGSASVTVALPDGYGVAQFSVSVAGLTPVDGGDFWTLYDADNGVRLLDIDYAGDFTETIEHGVAPSGFPWHFAYRSTIEAVRFQDNVTAIGDRAFDNYGAIKSVTIPDSVERIGYRAFYQCNSLESVTIPDNVTEIGQEAFYQCNSLESVTIPDNVTEIGQEAFYQCNSLKSVEIGSGVATVGTAAFRRCAALESLTLKSGLSAIGNFMFSECTAIKSVTIPSSVNIMGEAAFNSCAALKSVTIDYGIGIRYIATRAFSYCTSLTHITLPQIWPYGITEIDYGAFMHCYALKSVTIPTSVSNIGENAFLSCYALRDVYYRGTQSQWENIAIIPAGNSKLTSAAIHYLSSGPT